MSYSESSASAPDQAQPLGARVLEMADRLGVKFLRLQFTDILGVIKNVEFPDKQFEEALDGRIMFDGSSIEGFVRIEESDMYLVPDLDTFRVFPWTQTPGERVARVICDIQNPDGTAFAGCPRTGGGKVADKILVLDDDLDTLRLVGLMLEGQGFQIVAASSGSQALTLAKAELPDLVLLDIMMPDIDGLQVARQMRADPATQDILIIMFTAKGQIEQKLEGFEAGADDYFTKPTQPRELVAHVRAVLKRGKRPRATAPRDIRERGRVIGLISAKGGVGVSTLALNLGIALHHLEKKSVVVADFRPGCGRLRVALPAVFR